MNARKTGIRIALPALSIVLFLASTSGESSVSPGESGPRLPPNASAIGVARSEAAAQTLVSTTPPEWQVELWLNSPPLRLADLRGKVVMVRWWTAGCGYCSTSAPALRGFHETYGPRGLVVIGFYHHKEEGAFDPRVYEETAKKYRFTFPLAVDPEWRTLESWMRDAKGHHVDTSFTSVTFVLDKKGVVRHVHPGGQYVEGDAVYGQLRAIIERLLSED